MQLGDGDDTVTIATGLPWVTVLDGGAGDDVLTGAQEEDDFDPGPGRDRIDGGAGSDVLNFASRRAGVTVDIAAGRTSEADSFASIETVRGGAGPDHPLGGPRRDLLLGGAGDDVLSGRGGKDVLYGDLGADRLEGGGGHDYLNGDRQPGDGPDAPPRVRPDPTSCWAAGRRRADRPRRREPPVGRPRRRHPLCRSRAGSGVRRSWR